MAGVALDQVLGFPVVQTGLRCCMVYRDDPSRLGPLDLETRLYTILRSNSVDHMGIWVDKVR